MTTPIQAKMFAHWLSARYLNKPKGMLLTIWTRPPTRHVYPTPDAIAGLEAYLIPPCPQESQSGAEILQLLHEAGFPWRRWRKRAAGISVL